MHQQPVVQKFNVKLPRQEEDVHIVDIEQTTRFYQVVTHKELIISLSIYIFIK
jgi:hypothetical protein